MVLGGSASTSIRFKVIDFSTPWFETPIGFLIPYPISNENIAAIVKPFDSTVRFKAKFSTLKKKFLM